MEEEVVEKKKLDGGSLLSALKGAAKATVKSEKVNQEKKKAMLAELCMLNSLCSIANEFYSDANNLEVPVGYNKLETDPFAPPKRLVHEMLSFPTHKMQDD